jgi:2-(1,2-epoxy-1,2-dihydrophenyl)acetyl-CoA isomerase
MHTGSFRGFDAALHDPGILAITFNRPERLNGLDQWIKRDLVETLTQAQMDDQVRVIVFSGSGRAFCAGDDISGRGRDAGETLMADIPPGHRNPIGTYDGLRLLSQPIAGMIRTLDKLTVASMNGIAIQSGFSLALACDFRIASTAARMGSATLRFGLLPDEGGQFLLVQHMGVARAMDFLMRKRIVDAEEALSLNLVHEVVAPDELEARTMAFALELANGPQVAMRLLKRSLYNAAEMTFAHALDEIAAKTAISDHHADAREGTAAWREKREPRFNAWIDETAKRR